MSAPAAGPAATGDRPTARGFPPLVAATHDRLLTADDFDRRLTALLEAGLPAVWLRGRALPARLLLDRARAARDRAGDRAEVWVGDRVDVARMAAADRVQLPAAGLSIAGARRAAPGLGIGRSVHEAEEAREAIAEGAGHLVAGAVWPTASHPGRPPAGLALVRAAVEAAAGAGRAVPVVAIGGVDPGRAAEARAAGAAGVAAIRALWEAARPGEAVEAFLVALGREPAPPLH